MGEIIIEGRPWKQALISAFNPAAPFAPWHGIDDVARGDVAVVVLDTEPRTELCRFRVQDLTGVSWTIGHEMLTGNTRSEISAPADRAGDTPVAIAQIVVNARGRCIVCRGDVLINTEEQLDRFVHTASEADVRDGSDWPALLCDECATAMRDAGITSVVEFVFSRRPACPECSARRACDIGYGMPSFEWRTNVTPWETMGGCCVGPASWSCGNCGHEWGGDD